MRITFLILALVPLTACDRDTPPAPTSEQADQLDEVEAMLNDMANDTGNSGAENETGAAPEGTAPAISE